MCRYWYAGHVSAIEKSDFDQFLSRNRSSSRWVPPLNFGVFFSQRASPCLTMLVSADSAGGDPGRARVLFLGGMLFSFSHQNFPCVYSYVYRIVLRRTLLTLRRTSTYEFGRMYIYLPCISSTTAAAAAVLLYCCCCCRCMLLLLPVIVCRTAVSLLWFIASDSIVFILFIQKHFTFNVYLVGTIPLGSTNCCRICRLNLPIIVHRSTYHRVSVYTIGN